MIEVTDKDLYFAKMREGAVIPSKKDEDAGYDLYACFDEDYFVIEPGCTRPVPTGIAMAFSKRFYAQVEERGSTGKIGIKKSAGVFDSGYRGEYLILLYNTNKVPFVISKLSQDDMPEAFEVDDKTYNKNEILYYPVTKAICQLVFQEIPVFDEKEISYEELKNIASIRADGRFGHSGK